MNLLEYIYFKITYGDIENKIKRLSPIKHNTKSGKIKKISKELPTLQEFLKFKELNREIEEFINIFQTNFTKEQTVHMLKKIKTLKIKKNTYKTNKFPKTTISLVFYDSKNNFIILENYENIKTSQSEKKNTLNHELLHMASTKFTPLGIISGFEIPNIIGLNLNEGYTEYLNLKYFDKTKKYVETTNKNVIFAKGIENIVGEKKMSKYYFSANINSLINELSKYEKREEIVKLLFDIDRINKYFSTNKNYRNILSRIATINQKKLDQERRENKISQKEYSIQKAIKVEEYKMGYLWDESAKTIQEDNCFYIKDSECISKLYQIEEKEKRKKVLWKFIK